MTRNEMVRELMPIIWALRQSGKLSMGCKRVPYYYAMPEIRKDLEDLYARIPNNLLEEVHRQAYLMLNAELGMDMVVRGKSLFDNVQESVFDMLEKFTQ